MCHYKVCRGGGGRARGVTHLLTEIISIIFVLATLSFEETLSGNDIQARASD